MGLDISALVPQCPATAPMAEHRRDSAFIKDSTQRVHRKQRMCLRWVDCVQFKAASLQIPISYFTTLQNLFKIKLGYLLTSHKYASISYVNPFATHPVAATGAAGDRPGPVAATGRQYSST